MMIEEDSIFEHVSSENLEQAVEQGQEPMRIEVHGKKPQYKEEPEKNALAEKWQRRIESAKSHYRKFHQRIKHNRKVVAGFDWEGSDPDSDKFYGPRANLIHASITAMIPNMYAKNPELAVSPVTKRNDLKLFCHTLETVTNRYLDQAGLKQQAKGAVRASLTASFGVLKVSWQQDIRRDPIIEQRIQDAQDNITRLERHLMELEDPSQLADEEQLMMELRETVKALTEQVEVVQAEGLVIDRVMTENILVDPSVVDFFGYENADWIVQVIPMKQDIAEGMFGYKLDKARLYDSRFKAVQSSDKLFGQSKVITDDASVCIYEIWDKTTQRVYTMAEGLPFWLREPYSPENVGERWYPFFLLPYQVVDGTFIAPSLVDLTEKLQKEHNDARDKFNAHRDLIKPGYIASSDINRRTIDRFTSSELGEVTVVDAQGMNVNQVFVPKQCPPIDAQAYDVGQVRVDFEMVTGMQDATRSGVVNAKTATEANIMQQSLSARIGEFRDQIEDFLQSLCQYTAEILLMTVGEEAVAKIMGENPVAVDPVTGLPVLDRFGQPVRQPAQYDWRQMTREQAFDLVDMRIRAGSTGSPDQQEKQETWLKLIQIVQPLIGNIMQMQMQGVDASALVNLAKETFSRFDDRLEVEDFLPHVQPQMPQQMMNPEQQPQ